MPFLQFFGRFEMSQPFNLKDSKLGQSRQAQFKIWKIVLQYKSKQQAPKVHITVSVPGFLELQTEPTYSFLYKVADYKVDQTNNQTQGLGP